MQLLLRGSKWERLPPSPLETNLLATTGDVYVGSTTMLFHFTSDAALLAQLRAFSFKLDCRMLQQPDILVWVRPRKVARLIRSKTIAGGLGGTWYSGLMLWNVCWVPTFTVHSLLVFMCAGPSILLPRLYAVNATATYDHLTTQLLGQLYNSHDYSPRDSKDYGKSFNINWWSSIERAVNLTVTDKAKVKQHTHNSWEKRRLLPPELTPSNNIITN